MGMQNASEIKASFNKSKISLWFNLLLVLIIFGVTVAVCQEKSFDLYRYYYEAEINYETQPLSSVIEKSKEHNVDFLYPVLLYYALSLNIPLNLVTIIIVSTYFFLILSCIKEIYGGKINGWLILLVLFTTPTCWIVSMSRNLTAIMLLYLCVKSYYHRRWLLVALFAIMAVFTHFSVLMYVAVFITAFLLRNTHISKTFIVFLILLFVLVGLVFPSYMQNGLFYLIADQDIRYSNYSQHNDLGMFNTGLNYAAQLPTVLALAFSLYLLLLNKKQGIEYWALFVLTIMLSAFIFSSWTLSNRCMMVLPMFWGLNVALIYSDANNDTRNKLLLFSYFGMVVILLGIYGMRNIYFPSIFY